MEKKLVRQRDVIMVGLQPWDIEIGSNFKNMAIEISQDYRVLYVNRPLDRITSIKDRNDIKTINRKNSIKRGVGVLSEIKNNLWILNPQVMLESINWLPPGKLYQYFNKKNNIKFASQITVTIRQLQFKNPLLIIDNDFHNSLYLKEYLKIDCMVYYLRDYLLSQPYFYKHGVKSEPAILEKADVVTTNSIYLANYAKEYNPDTWYIGQGCDVKEFENKPSKIPSDLVNLKKPVIGYCGALLSLRLDLNLLIGIAEQRPEWSLVLVGPEDLDFRKSRLHTFPNVHFLGHKPLVELPEYVHHFDVCINPQVINQMTIGNYPRKIDEYLAAGKPVVATKTETMEVFADCTYLCNNLQEYLSAIEKAMAEPDDGIASSKRVEVARSHTWLQSISKLYSAVNNFDKA